MTKHTIEFLMEHRDEPKYQDAYYQYLKDHKNEPEFIDAYTSIRSQRKHRRQEKVKMITVSIVIVILILNICYHINPESFNSFTQYLIEILKHPIIV